MSATLPNDPSSYAPGPNQDPFSTAKASALRAAEELRSSTAAKAQELRQAAEARAANLKAAAQQQAGEFKDYADQAISDARERYADILVEGERYVREKPVQAVATAFGVGLFLGLLLRR
jgi:ElaB/YqjD/DUF883 family membrane-anchored ribosome-binding protein